MIKPNKKKIIKIIFELFGILEKLFTFTSDMQKENILTKELLDISKKIKKKYPHWTELIAADISKTKEWKMYSDKECTIENARHISTGKIKSQFHRRLFMAAANRVLLSAKKETEVISNLIGQTQQ